MEKTVMGSLILPASVGSTPYNISIGFIPDRVRVWNVNQATTPYLVEWNKFLTDKAIAGGIKSTPIADNGSTAALALSKLAKDAGIKPFYGGAKVETLADTNKVYDTNNDKRVNSNGTISRWTLTHSTNGTGKVNVGVDTTVVGVGSRICIGDQINGGKRQWATIVAITNDGDADNEIELDRPIGSGEVLALTGKVSHISAPVGTILPDGFTIAIVANIVINDAHLAFEASKVF